MGPPFVELNVESAPAGSPAINRAAQRSRRRGTDGLGPGELGQQLFDRPSLVCGETNRA